MAPPAVTVVGDVVSLREKLRWFDTRPLYGKRVLVTRSREQASLLAERLAGLGAEPVEFPTIRIVPPEDFGPVDEAIADLASYQWVIFTSVNGVKALGARLQALGKDARALAGVKVAAIGPATAKALAQYGLVADYVPDKYVAEEVAAGLGQVAGQRILLPRADIAREALAVELGAKGAVVDEVTAYRTVPAEPSDDVRQMLLAGEVDIVTFTSSSTVRNFAALLDGLDPAQVLAQTVVACIGPITAQTARELGIRVDVVAEEYTINGLVEALTENLSHRKKRHK
jgi:uroporphyrinogen III methyltransferase/synthase